MPYLYLLKYWHYAVIALLIAALSVVIVMYKERGHKIDEIQAKHKLELVTAQAEYQAKARQIEQTSYQGVIDAINASEQRQKQIANDYRTVVATNDSLSNTIDHISTIVTKDNANARADYISALGAVSKECGAELVKMAEIADRHASDSLMYQHAWPKN